MIKNLLRIFAVGACAWCNNKKDQEQVLNRAAKKKYGENIQVDHSHRVCKDHPKPHSKRNKPAYFWPFNNPADKNIVSSKKMNYNQARKSGRKDIPSD